MLSTSFWNFANLAIQAKSGLARVVAVSPDSHSLANADALLKVVHQVLLFIAVLLIVSEVIVKEFLELLVGEVKCVANTYTKPTAVTRPDFPSTSPSRWIAFCYVFLM